MKYLMIWKTTYAIMLSGKGREKTAFTLGSQPCLSSKYKKKTRRKQTKMLLKVESDGDRFLSFLYLSNSTEPQILSTIENMVTKPGQEVAS